MAELGSAAHDGIEYRLYVSLRLSDGLQDLTRCCLLFQSLTHLSVSLGQRTIFLLQLCEQPHILNGDDGLVGKDLQELDLLVRKSPHLLPAKEERADRHALP